MAFYRFIRVLFYLPVKMFMPTKKIGALPKEGKYILTCNHQSFNDSVNLMVNSKRTIHFVGKKEIFKNRFLAWGFRHMGVGCVDREKPDLSSFKSIFKILKEEQLLGIFPEGTRNKKDDGNLLEFKNGVALIALKTKTSIVPMRFLRKPKFFRRNILLIGEPIDLSEFYDKGTEKEVLDEVTKLIFDATETLKTNYLAQKSKKK